MRIWTKPGLSQQPGASGPTGPQEAMNARTVAEAFEGAAASSHDAVAGAAAAAVAAAAAGVNAGVNPLKHKPT